MPEFTHLRIRAHAVSLGSLQFDTGDIVDIRDVDAEESDIGLRQLTGVSTVLAKRRNNYPPLEAGSLDADGKFVPIQVDGAALERTAKERDGYSPEAQKLTFELAQEDG